MIETKPTSIVVELDRPAMGVKIRSVIFDVVTRANRPGTAIDIVQEIDHGRKIVIGQASAVSFKELRITPIDAESFGHWEHYFSVRITSYRWNLLTEGRDPDASHTAEEAELAISYYNHFGKVLNEVLDEM